MSGAEIVWLSEVGSTNDWLRERRGTLPDGAACATDRQTRGRGRRGRIWQAPPGQTLALSLLFHRGALPALPLVCALATADALTALTGGTFHWKWPNDIICGGRKVCGILCESFAEGTQLDTVAGIGVNLGQTEADFQAAGLPYAASLRLLTGVAPDAKALAFAITERLRPMTATLADRGLTPFLPAYTAGCITLKNPVRVLASDGRVTLTGTATAVDADGALVVTDACGHRTVCRAGEVSVRGLYGYTGENSLLSPSSQGVITPGKADLYE